MPTDVMLYLIAVGQNVRVNVWRSADEKNWALRTPPLKSLKFTGTDTHRSDAYDFLLTFGTTKHREGPLGPQITHKGQQGDRKGRKRTFLYFLVFSIATVGPYCAISNI